jgi:hypothetical protein
MYLSAKFGEGCLTPAIHMPNVAAIEALHVFITQRPVERGFFAGSFFLGLVHEFFECRFNRH